MLTYTVSHQFGHEGKLYTRADADAIRKLPRDVRDRQIELGHITEHGAPAAAKTAKPATIRTEG